MSNSGHLIGFMPGAVVPPVDTPQHWWPLDGDVLDYGSLAPLNGSATNITFVAGLGGNQRASFDGATSFIDILYNTFFDFGAGDFSMFSWIKTTDATADLIAGFNNTAPFEGFALAIGASKQRFFAGDGVGSEFIAETTTNVDDNTDKFVGVTRTGSTLNFYVDAVIASTKTINYDPLGSTQNINIGRDTNTSPSRYFAGLMQDVRMYNVFKTPAEVLAIKQELVP